MSVSEHAPLLAFPAFIDYFRPRDHDSALLQQLLARFVLFFFLIVDLPQLDQFVIGCQQLGFRAAKGINPFDSVYFFGNLR